VDPAHARGERAQRILATRRLIWLAWCAAP
jgi:hypothetical protein